MLLFKPYQRRHRPHAPLEWQVGKEEGELGLVYICNYVLSTTSM